MLNLVRSPFPVMTMDRSQLHDLLVCMEVLSLHCHLSSAMKFIACEFRFNAFKFINFLPICCSGADSSHSTSHCPDNFRLPHKEVQVFERM